MVGVRCRDGVVLAGDRILVRDGRVESRNRTHVFDFAADAGDGTGDTDGNGAVGAAAVGTDVDRFADRLGGELRSYRLERGPVSLVALERFASDVARETGTEAVVAVRDDDGRATLHGVYADGATLDDPPMAFGSGASLALGRLEAAELSSLALDDCESVVRETFATVAERDPGTGDTVDVWTLPDR